MWSSTLFLVIGLVVLCCCCSCANLRYGDWPSGAAGAARGIRGDVCPRLSASTTFSLMALTHRRSASSWTTAIVVVENIYRYVEKGLPPLEAAMKGSSEIGFTCCHQHLAGGVFHSHFC